MRHHRSILIQARNPGSVGRDRHGRFGGVVQESPSTAVQGVRDCAGHELDRSPVVAVRRRLLRLPDRRFSVFVVDVYCCQGYTVVTVRNTALSPGTVPTTCTLR